MRAGEEASSRGEEASSRESAESGAWRRKVILIKADVEVVVRREEAEEVARRVRKDTVNECL
jgi:hypothetical protein